jgi:hypothetical protein
MASTRAPEPHAMATRLGPIELARFHPEAEPIKTVEWLDRHVPDWSPTEHGTRGLRWLRVTAGAYLAGCEETLAERLMASPER